jgi:putative two-component system response regulator
MDGIKMINNINSRKKILLIDDNEMHLKTAELFLEADYDIFKAKSGNEALEFLYNNQYTLDLILLDIIMPEMDGWEVFRKIKGIALLKNVPIAFLTSVDEKSEKEKAHKLGAVDYITKPYNMTLLQRTVKEILRKNENN